jgi:[ribosomal protein S5]-alanine N-acetyltransferase
MRMPVLDTSRLLIRPLVMVDMESVYQLVDVDLADIEIGTEGSLSREERRRWLEWSVLNYEALASMHQPPYGDRGVILRETGELIGLCGYVPAFGPFDQLPSFGGDGQGASSPRLFTPEIGLYWAIAPMRQRQGFATEAARALIDYGFAELRLKRIIATTTYDNQASISVMRKAGMRVERNPLAEPGWFQIVGVLENRSDQVESTS